MQSGSGNKCRVCLRAEGELHYLFAEFDQGVSLSDIFTMTTNFQATLGDLLPQYLCESCTNIIIDFYNLKIIYQDSENHLKNINSNEEIFKQIEKQTGRLSDNDELGQDPGSIKLEIYSDSDDEHNLNNQDPITITYHDKVIKYTCSNCDQYFFSKQIIENHMMLHGADKITPNANANLQSRNKTNEGNVTTCKFCGETFDTPSDCNEHLETHKKNVCDVCGAAFTKKSYLKDHKEVHDIEKRHICQFCNKAFRRRTVLVKHRRIHTHPRECICEICGKAFNDKGTLKTHIKLLHIKDRQFVCMICGIKFPLKSSLEKHIRRHQNKEREFFCFYCPLGYKDKSSLDRHVYVKHSGSSNKVLCPDCGKEYTTRSNLHKHRRSCHNDM